VKELIVAEFERLGLLNQPIMTLTARSLGSSRMPPAAVATPAVSLCK